MKTYSIITLGGTILESGLTKEQAEERKENYFIKEDEQAIADENSPTFEEYLKQRSANKTLTKTSEIAYQDEENKNYFGYCLKCHSYCYGDCEASQL